MHEDEWKEGRARLRSRQDLAGTEDGDCGVSFRLTDEIWNMTWFAPESLPLQTFLIARACFFVLAILHATFDTTHT